MAKNTIVTFVVHLYLLGSSVKDISSEYGASDVMINI